MACSQTHEQEWWSTLGADSLIGYKLFEILYALDALRDAADVQTQFRRIAASYGLKTIAYIGTGFGRRANSEPYVAATYSPEWIERYKSKSYLSIDPVFQLGMRRLLPIDWREFGKLSKKVRVFFGEAAEFGLGRQGLTVPVHGPRGDSALFSVTSDLSEREWTLNRKFYARDFQVLAIHTHAKLVERGEMPAETVSLSPRERECLAWVAEGKTVWESSVILGLSSHTVRCYLESARHKLAASSNTHAVAKAMKLGLLPAIP